MTETIDDGGFAFPQQSDSFLLDTPSSDGTRCMDAVNKHAGGMTMRAWLAGKALPMCYRQMCDYCDRNGWPDGWRDGIADDAIRMADTLIRKLKEPPHAHAQA